MFSRLLFTSCVLQINILFAQSISNSADSPEYKANITHFLGEDCHRPCAGNETRTCYFKFVVEYYHAMGPACGKCAEGEITDCFKLHCLTADGVEKGVMSINRKIPGPEVNVCKNDVVIVDVINRMAGTSTSLHWHGIHQRDTPFMDGVPYITQCPINFGTTFRYHFRASEAGTHFYHAHAGHHKVNGLYGAFIVREHNDQHSSLYDHDLREHTIIISDWMHYTAEMFAFGLPTREPGPLPVNVLINGKGTFYDKTKGKSTKSPVQVYKVESGTKYRFRLIDSAALECPLQIQVQAHNLVVIATDGKSIEPVTVDTLITAAGERYDFIIEADQKPDIYCIKVKLLGECDEDGGIEQYGVLSYFNFSDVKNDHIDYASAVTHCRSIGIQMIGNSFLNHPNMTCNDPSKKHYCPTDLTSIEVDKILLNATVDQRFYFGFDNYAADLDEIFQENFYTHFLSDGPTEVVQAAVNNISFTSPSFNILTQTNEITDGIFCDENNLPKHCANRKICPCTHRIKIELNSVVEIVLIDDRESIGPENHPFHMHGYSFTVTEIGQDKKQRMTIPEYKRLEREHQLPVISSNDAVLKDTVNIPSNGYAVVRFRADNPGFWLLHCHFEWHMIMGMSLIVQVGEFSDFVRAPEGFPVCGDYVPKLDL